MSNEETQYNPFNDKEVKLTKQVSQINTDNREGFNDVIKHYDAINGHMVPKKVEHFPKKYRKALRIVITIWVLSFLVTIFYSFISNIPQLIK